MKIEELQGEYRATHTQRLDFEEHWRTVSDGLKEQEYSYFVESEKSGGNSLKSDKEYRAEFEDGYWAGQGETVREKEFHRFMQHQPRRRGVRM